MRNNADFVMFNNHVCDINPNNRYIIGIVKTDVTDKIIPNYKGSVLCDWVEISRIVDLTELHSATRCFNEPIGYNLNVLPSAVEGERPRTKLRESVAFKHNIPARPKMDWRMHSDKRPRGAYLVVSRL